MKTLRAEQTKKIAAQADFIRCHPWRSPFGPLRRSKLFHTTLWEGRFKSQALLDEAALAACMAYVDLNPIRAKMAKTPEESDHTSAQQRITHAEEGKQPKQLLRFAGMPRQIMPKGLPFELKSYLELVELTGRIIREDKRGHIDNMNLPLLERLNISPENWLKLTTQFTRVFHGAVGRPTSQASYCENLKRKRRSNISNCEKLLA